MLHRMESKSGKTNENVDDIDDEEITSESEDEDEKPSSNATQKSVDSNLSMNKLMQKAGVKRKLKPQDYPDFLTKRHCDMQSFRFVV